MASNPTFTPDEQAFATQVLALADPNQLGIVPGDVAVKIFAGSDIPADTLGDIWQMADQENNGFLTRKGLSIALRLMSHVQFGETVDEKFINQPAPPPTIKGITAVPVSAVTPRPVPRAVPSTPRPVPPIPVSRPSTAQAAALPVITAEDRAKFTRIFAQSGPVNGLLSGEKARDVFLKSKLPFDTLGLVWALADTQSRGSLDLTDFILGMYFIQSIMNKSMPTLPPNLPPGLYEQASGGRARVGSPAPISPISRQSTGQQPVHAHMTGGSLHSAPSPGLTSQFPQQVPDNQRSRSITRVNSVPTGTASAFSLGQHRQGPQSWDVSPAEKATSDRFFVTLDTSGQGYITGDIAVPFMLESKLPEAVLAHVWDLADMDNSGQLDKDGFAVAMHLINGQLAGRDVPAALPPSLIPPSRRDQSSQAAPKTTVDDLFSLMEETPATAPAFPTGAPQSPPITTVLHPQATGQRPLAASTVLQPQVTGQKPSTASVALQAQATGHRPAVASPFDFLGEDEPEPASSVPDRSVELGNLQNQLASTERSVASAKAEREPLEKKVADSASQIAHLESQLAVARASHDTETRLLSDLRARSSAQSEQIRVLREDLIRAESDLSALRVEKAEVESALLRDKEDVRDMQKKMRVIGDETEKVKVDVEKAKNDARLQKGLVAIAKKQLATAEAEKAKALEALAASEKEVEDARRATEEAEAAAAATRASIPAPPASVPPPAVLSPTLERSMAIPLPETPERMASPNPLLMSQKSNNPFDRLKGFSSGSSSPMSPEGFLPFLAPAVGDDIEPRSNTSQRIATATGSESQPPAIAASIEAPQAEVGEVLDENEDPFGLASEAQLEGLGFGEEAGHSIDAVGAETVTSPTDTAEPTFHTPPTSAHLDSQTSEGQADALEAAQDHFPPLEDLRGDDSGELAPLSEVVQADDDSSDEEGDQDKAGEAVALVTPSAQEPLMAHGESSGLETPRPVTGDAVGLSAGSPAPAAPDVSRLAPNAFDDAFGDISSPTQPSAPNGFSAHENQESTFGTDLELPKTVTPSLPSVSTDDQSTSFGVDAFDEALGQVTTGGDISSSFKFDSAFGDSFDFGTGSTAASTSAPSTAPTINGAAGISLPDNSLSGVDDFDTVFNGTGTSGSGISQSSNAPSLSFDDAFVVAPPIVVSPQPSRTDSTRSIFAANMVSPMNPPRKTGPKNKTLILNPNMPAVFHATLAPPAQPSRSGTATPAVADDVEGVKQLCGMGFSRSQAVEALEKYGYDVQKALNSLLG